MWQKKAQGTIEYLVVVAVVIIIALIITTLMLNTSTNQDISKNSNDLSSKIGSGSISVSEAITDSEGDSIITLQNTSSDPITITKISTGDQESSYSQTLVQGNTIAFSLTDINVDCPCVSNAKSVSCEYTITYTQNGITKKAFIKKETECVTNIIPSNPSQIIGLGSGTLADPWIINSCEELQDMNNHLDGNYSLGADINCYNTRTWNLGAGFNPVGNFRGNFNGNRHTISGLFINRPSTDSVGLFNVVDNLVTNIGLTDLNIIGKDYVGGLAGIVRGTVSNSYSTGNVKGTSFSGGLAGYVSLGLVSNSFSSAVVEGSSYSGGLAGALNDGNVSNSYATGNVSSPNNVGGLVGAIALGTITNSYSTGNVDGSNNVGGLVGYSNDENISGSFTTSNLVSDANGGLVGVIIPAPNVTSSYWYKREGNTLNCYNIGNAYCTEIFDVNGGVEWFYYNTNMPMSSGSWTFGSNANWNICQGQGYPWLSWENKTC